ncbi:MAG TPA: ethanolamine ammonia-lyase subunit EutC [Chthoniobacteraceae bacterium]|jgi:ethanolamine ammonia-lyase small subunit|nr:ethanolamine ammonia-lyase subunit EutC [Chthoniobacteraceae bacterium]
MAPDPWVELRRRTAARIALGRTGGSQPTRGQLEFRLAHARARDAVLSAFDAPGLAARLGGLAVESAAAGRAEYLQRPDLGRTLSPASRALLTREAAGRAACDLVIVVSDGLSNLAVETQAAPLLQALLPLLHASGWSFAPIVVAQNGRVALQDEIGEILRASLSLMLLGERPGLGNADSLGAYFTYHPRPGRTDAERNCVSNIREGGLSPADAAVKLHWLLEQARRREVSGVLLKDEAPAAALPGGEAKPQPIVKML